MLAASSMLASVLVAPASALHNALVAPLSPQRAYARAAQPVLLLSDSQRNMLHEAEITATADRFRLLQTKASQDQGPHGGPHGGRHDAYHCD